MIRSCSLVNPWYNNNSFIVVATLLVAASAGLHCTSNPCMYGICLEDVNSTYSCYCIDGYTGINCEINWNDCWSDPCMNGGTCNDAVAAYNCTCIEGFVGANCEQKFSECLNTPCLNNGTCLDYNGFTCQCLEGYSGEYCEIDASVCNNTICKNSGECIEGPGFSFSCRCSDGWTGELCEVDIDECTESPCENGGLCINIPASYTCACLFGFTGKNCDKRIVPCDSNPCENNAICLLEDNQLVCYCVPDYHGPLCEMRYNECESRSARCENGGTCIDGVNNFTCSCPPNYTGETCREFAPPTTFTSEEMPGLYSRASSMPTTIMPSQSSDESSTETVVVTDGTDEPPISSTTSYVTYSESEQISSGSTSYMSTTNTGSTIEFTNENTSFVRTTPKSLHPSSATTDQTYPYIKYSTSIGDIFTSTHASSTETSGTSFTASTEFYPTASSMSEMTPETTSEETSVYSTNKIVPEATPIFTTEFITVTMREITIKTPTVTLRGSTDALPIATTGRVETIGVTPVTSVVTSNGSYVLSTDGYSTQSSTINIITTTEKHSVINNCTQQPCMNTTVCQNVTTECNCSYPQVCTTSPDISNAAFNGKSYIRQDLSVDSDGRLQIFIRLKTQSKNGIIVHAFFDEDRYILLYMELGQLKFQFSCGLQTMLLGEIDSPINNGYDVDVEMRFQYMKVSDDTDKCSAKLLVNDTVAMSGEQVVSSQDDIPQHARLHLGGIPLAFSHYFPHVAVGLIGCMSLLKVNDVQKHLIRDSSDTFQIEECTSFLCLSNPCKNFGACQEINGNVHCECISGYTGEMCEKSACDDNPCQLGATCTSSPGAGFLCICPFGTHGLLCEEEITIVQPMFTVFIPGVSSYIAYGLSGSIKDSMELKMRLIPQSVEQISLIAFMGQSSLHRDLSDHLAITYVRGYIMLTWDLGSGVRRIFTSTPLTTKAHRPHTLRIGRKGRDAWLSVDGLGNVTGRAAGTMTQMDVAPVLYIGGHKSKNFDTLPHDLPLHTGFSGCIFDVELRIESTVFPVTNTSPATGRGVGECHRNECTHRTCKNGAVCLNHGPTYSCVCTKDWKGPDCSTPTAICSASSPHCQKNHQRGS